MVGNRSLTVGIKSTQVNQGDGGKVRGPDDETHRDDQGKSCLRRSFHNKGEAEKLWAKAFLNNGLKVTLPTFLVLVCAEPNCIRQLTLKPTFWF